jgi:3-hydroxybutyryl-CoA dehydrogenase
MIKNICVIGAGTMGNGIAHVFLLNGFNVTLIDQKVELLENAWKKISDNMERQVKKGIVLSEQRQEALKLLTLSDSILSIKEEIELVIEAIIENKKEKISLYEKICPILSPDCILATNTSSISITELAPQKKVDKFIGMHFMNPVPVMDLVEVIKGHSTSNETFAIIKSVVEKIHKIPISVNDSPGFISNRILMQLINEAIFCLYENIASLEDIDKIFKLGMNHPMGPLKLADFIGLDVCLNILDVMFDGFKDTKYRPCPLLVKMVFAGKLGKKVGEGFYKYST